MEIEESHEQLPRPSGVMPHSVFEAVASAQSASAEKIVTGSGSGPTQSMPAASLSGRWRRTPLEEGVDGSAPGLDDSRWPVCDVPDSYGAEPALSRYFGPVWYRKRIGQPDLRDRPTGLHFFDLVFEGADYFCEVYLDGRRLGEHEGYACGFRFDVSDILTDGSLLAVKVRCPLEELDPAAFFISHRKRQIKGTLSYHDSRPAGLPGATTPGWTPETAQSYPTGGLTAPVVLRATGPLRLDAVFVTPRDTRGAIHIAAVMTNRTDAAISAELALSIAPPRGGRPEDAMVRFEAPPGHCRLDLDATLESVLPWELGEEVGGRRAGVYSLGAQLLVDGSVSDSRTTRFGLRTFDVWASAESWTFELNGRRVPLKAANYIPLQHFARASRELYDTDIALARGASMNSLGVHAHIQPEAFYDAADDAGILVFQDFSLQWTYDSGKADNPGFVDKACRMASEMVYRLWNHPSVVYWCAHNEPPYVWFRGDSEAEPDADIDNKALDLAVEEAISRTDPTRYVHRASGTVDSHRYEGSLSGGRLSDFCDAPAGFVSEYGFWSAAYSAARYGDQGWPPDEETLLEWAGRLSFFGSTSTYVGAPSRYDCFQDWVYATQRYQAMLLKYMTEWMRSWRVRGLGGYRMHFLVDWGGFAGGGLFDRDRRPKLAYEWMARANAEVLAAALIKRTFITSADEEPIELWAFSDSPRRQALDIEWSLAEAGSYEIITSDPAAAALGGTGIAAPPDARVAIPRGPSRGRMLDGGEAHLGLEPYGARKFAELTVSASDPRFAVSEDGVPRMFVVDLRFSWGGGSVTNTNWGAIALAPEGWDAGPGMWPRPRFDLGVRVKGRGKGHGLRLHRRHRDGEGWREAETDPSGRARFAGIPPDEYDLEIAGAPGRVSIDLFDDIEVDVEF